MSAVKKEQEVKNTFVVRGAEGTSLSIRVLDDGTALLCMIDNNWNSVEMSLTRLQLACLSGGVVLALRKLLGDSN